MFQRIMWIYHVRRIEWIDRWIDKAKKRELGELILGLLFYLGYEFNYLKTGISADIGYFNRVWYDIEWIMK